MKPGAAVIFAFVFGFWFGWALHSQKMVTIRWRWDEQHYDTIRLRPGSCMELSHSGTEGYAEGPCK
jgi:hypothetical protein